MNNNLYVKRPTGLVDVVLDTDAYNEIDDQFAIAYLLASPKEVNIRAFYAAPFHNQNSNSPQDGMEKSYQEILNLLTLAGKTDLHPKVFKGAPGYLIDEKTPVISDGARHLANLAAEYTPENPLYVLTIGAITNIAAALLINPAIAPNMVVVWLGGHGYHYPNTAEFNMRQDVAAARVVFNSDVALVQLPCMGVVDILATTEPELRHWLYGKNALCNYLVDHTTREAEGYAKGKPWSRVIWDISAVAWLLDRDGSMVLDRMERRPIPQYDHHYSFSPDRAMVNYVYRIHRDRVFEDLFTRLGAMEI